MSTQENEPGPRCRYSRIYWGKLRTSGDPADKDLYLASDNGTTIVCFSPGDMPGLRAAALPESEGLKALQDIWSASLGPGGRGAVEAGHAAGYKLGVEDMEATPAYRPGPVDAGDVERYLAGHLDDDGLSAAEEEAMRTVIEVITRDQRAWRS